MQFPEQLAKARDIDFINKLWDILQVDAQPGWFHLIFI